MWNNRDVKENVAPVGHRSIFLTSQVNTLKDHVGEPQSFCIVVAQADVEAGSSGRPNTVLSSLLEESPDNMLITDKIIPIVKDLSLSLSVSLSLSLCQ